MTLDETRSLHHARESAPHPDFDGPALVPADRDALDHAAHHLAQLRCVGVDGMTDRLLDLLRRGVDHRIDVLGHVERGRGLKVLQGLQIRLQPERFGLELLELGEQGGVVSGIGDRVDDAIDLSLLLLHRGREVGPRLVRCAREPLALFDHFGTQPRHSVLVHPTMSDGIPDEPLQVCALDPEIVRARAFRPEIRAAVMARITHGEGRSAGATFDQPRQEMLGPVSPVESHTIPIPRHHGANLALLRLDPLPERVVDDPQAVVGRLLPILLGIAACQPVAGGRIPNIRDSVPNDPADIKLVVEEARATIDLAADGGVDPLPTTRAGNALRVQFARDSARGSTRRIILEDAPDHLGLMLDDEPLALRVRVDPVAVGQRSGTQAGQNLAREAALGLAFQVVEESLGHGAEDADHQAVDLAAICGEQPDLPKLDDVVEIREIGQATAQAIDGLDDDDVEHSPFRVLQQALIFGAQDRRARERGIGIGGDHLPTHGVATPTALQDLVLDRLRPLLVRRVASVDRGALGLAGLRRVGRLHCPTPTMCALKAPRCPG